MEPDLVAVSSENAVAAARALATFPLGNANAAVVADWVAGNDVDPDDFIRVVGRVGKGRFAQRLATCEDTVEAPDHLASALEYLTD